MLVNKKGFQDSKLPPFIVQRIDKKNPDGKFIVNLFSKVVIVKHNDSYKKRYEYRPLTFDGTYARFKSRRNAANYARYILALD